METIQPNARVVLDYKLEDEEGELLDASDAEGGEPIVYVHGYGMLVPGLEAALAGLRRGDEKVVTVAPEEGFGDRDEELVLEVDRSELPHPETVAAGDEVVAESPDGGEIPMRIVEVKDQTVVVDANHPLAGRTLRYSVVVKEVSRASDEEIAEAAEAFEEAGYADGVCDDPTHDHGPRGGHHHDDGGPNGERGGPSGELVQLAPKRSGKLR